DWTIAHALSVRRCRPLVPAGRHASRSARRRRGSSRGRFRLAAPLAAIGVAATAVQLMPQDRDPDIGAVGPIWSTPGADVEALRTRAAEEPGRSVDSPRTSPTTTPPPSRTPTPTRTGFAPVDGCD